MFTKRIIVAVLISLFMVPAVYANEFKEGGKEVGQGFKQMGKATGKVAKSSGKAIGMGFKKAGQETGKAMKVMGKQIGQSFKSGG
jgi:hypothetical protein